MSGRQAGQALVGALVVTTLAFLMAGTVAVGASALLSQESNPQNASSRDLAAQDALAAAVAGVAGRGRANGPVTCSQPISTTLPNGYRSQALCVRADGVQPGPLTLVPLPWSGGCAVVDVSRYSANHVLMWFSAYADVSVWVDNTQSGCRQRRPICSSSGNGPVAQVVLDCDLLAESQEGGGNNGSLYLHVQNPAQSPVLVRLAQYSSSGGSIYVLAANTGLARGPAFEEADVWVSGDGSTTALRFESTL